MPTFDDGKSEWRGEIAYPPDYKGCEPPDGGIVLKDITHQQYHFARDVRVIGFWITYDKIEKTGSTEDKRFYVIDRSNFTFQCIEKLSASDLDLKKQDATTPPDTLKYFLSSLMAFNFYPFIYAIRAIYRSKDSFFPPNCDMGKLTINQSYLFSAYSSSPAHEPTGGLTAARFSPQINTLFQKNPKLDRSVYPQFEVKSIRFDFRFHLALDTFVDTPAVPTGPIATPQNFAGVFRDQEAFPKIPGRAAHTIFEATEKPLIFEIAAKGFLHTNNKLTDKIRAWDNVHWWGARWISHWRPLGANAKELIHISAPGAFFAVHFHWRWGGVARDTYPGLTPKYGSDPQFKGVPGTSGILIDPHVPDQDLQFAIAKYDAATDPEKASLPSLSNPDFLKLFPGTPKDISKGDNIVLWVGAGFNRGANKPLLNGTQLVHGFFFGHNPEPGFFSAVGSTSAEYFPTDEKTIRASPVWERY